jgi:hypothetical protein
MAKDFGVEGLGDKTEPPMVTKQEKKPEPPKKPMKDFGAEGLGDLTGPPELTKPVKKAKGGSVSSASKRADGCCVKGKTRGRMV